jgi:predicted alpha/beta-fold hydrolase
VLLPIKPRKPGIVLDQNYVNPYMNLHYDEYPLESIEAPVLILHAKNDPMAKYETMKQAAVRFQDATVVTYETGGHVLFGHDKENREYIREFLQEHD